jgi:hypothetical protein
MSTYHYMKSSIVLFAAMWLVNPSHALALVINPFYDASITGDATNGAAIKADVQTAINFYETTFTAPITAQIIFSEGPGSYGPGLGGSSFQSTEFSDYNTIYKPALVVADANSSIGRTAISNLPSVPAGTSIFYSSAEGRALGLTTPGHVDGHFDGGVQLGYGNQYILPPPGGPVDPRATYGFQIIQHEINEILGIGGFSFRPSSTILGPMNLFSHQDSVGNFHFSIDGGHTLREQFIGLNTQGFDPGDWIPNCSEASNTVQGADCPGTLNRLDASSSEVVALNLLGFGNNPVGAPEPATFLLMASGLGGILLNKLRKKKLV